MSLAPCRVTYTDADGLLHSIEVEAETLYEAVALAIAEFRQDEMLEDLPKLMTEFTVCVIKKPVEHKVHLSQVQKWAEPSVRDGPAGILKRERIRKLLGAR